MKKVYLAILFFLGATQAFAQAVVPPATWQEHWFGHSEILYRMYYDNDVAIYYDSGVSSSITWPNALVGDVWRYTKSVYGDFGPENRVYGIFHSNSGISGGHPATWGDDHHDYRNAIDLGGSWASPTGWNLDATVHEVGHIVEGGSKGVLGSPSFSLWHDSKWNEIYQYDVYTHLGWNADATRWYNSMIQGVDDFPSPNSHWFRDWFYPIYSQHGGNQVLNKYFTLLSQYFPQSGNHYARDLNWGEFIHFWSGAAGVDLKPLATTAFGWTNEWETQYTKAKADYNFSAPPAGGPAGYTKCSWEDQICKVTGNATVAYGTGTSFVYKDISTSISCDNNAFGSDPAPNTPKACYYRLKVAGPAGYTACASENQTCSFTGKASVAYGANNVFNYIDATNSILCSNSVFGDPIANVTKSCFYRAIATPTGPAGYTLCAGENQTCSFSGKASVAYGANGVFNYLDATNNIVCSNTVFGDPLPGVLKSCYSSTTTTAFTKQIEAEACTSMNGVQLETTADTGGGQNVGWIDANDWMAYANINFPTTGNYKVEYRVASPSGSTLSLDLNAGAIQLGQLTIPATGGWQTWATISNTVSITAGTYSVGVFAPQGGWNINWVKFTKL